MKKLHFTDEEKKTARRAKQQKYYLTHKTQQEAYKQKYRATHKQEESEYWKNYALTHREEISAYNKAHYAANKSEYKEYYKNYRLTPESRITAMLSSARTRAKRKGLPFTLTYQIVQERLLKLNGVAEVVPDRFDFSSRGHRKKNPYAPSIDQKRPGDGYTEENFQIVTVWYNHLKGDLTDDEALTILRNAKIPPLNVR